jgi:hypothetical protein
VWRAVFVYLGSPAALDSVPLIVPAVAEGASNGEENETVAEIHFGSASGLSLYGASLLEANAVGANFGENVRPLGDLDGDGCQEFFVGAIRCEQSAAREGAAFPGLSRP